MNEADHKLKLRLVHEVLGALDIVDPGLSLGRGIFCKFTVFPYFPNVQFSQSGNFTKVRLGLLRRHRLQEGMGRALRLEQVKARTTAARTDLESCSLGRSAHLGSCRWGSCRLEKLTFRKLQRNRDYKIRTQFLSI